MKKKKKVTCSLTRRITRAVRAKVRRQMRRSHSVVGKRYVARKHPLRPLVFKTTESGRATGALKKHERRQAYLAALKEAA